MTRSSYEYVVLIGILIICVIGAYIALEASTPLGRLRLRQKVYGALDHLRAAARPRRRRY